MPLDAATRRLFGHRPVGNGQKRPDTAAADARPPQRLADAPIQVGDYMPPDKYATLPPAGTISRRRACQFTDAPPLHPY